MATQEPMFPFPVNVNTRARRAMTQRATPKSPTPVDAAENQKHVNKHAATIYRFQAADKEMITAIDMCKIRGR